MYLPVALICLFLSCGSDHQIPSMQNSDSKTFYVDSVNGNDSNDGLSEGNSLRSLSKIESMKLYPGDTVRFRRGSVFTGPLVITDSGDAVRRIVVTDYGDNNLPAPSFTNTLFQPEKSSFGNCIRLKGSYILLENIYCHHTPAQLPSSAGGFTTMWELGAIYIDKTATHCIVRNNELYDCGVGIKSYGEYAVIKNNYIHDCTRVLKEWSWGPIGIWLGTGHQEVSFNRIFNYSEVDPRITWGPDSYGGGADGGAIEIDDARIPKSDIFIHHNHTRDCQGFLEVTWSDVQQNPAYSGFNIHHNISDDYQQFVAMWRGESCRIENNTIIRRKRNANDWGVFNITQAQARNQIRNNIVVVANDIVIFNVGKKGTAQPASIIANNLYFAVSGNLAVGLEGPGANPVYGDPGFVNMDPGNLAEDFMIKAGSPAINKGLSIGYTTDFAGTVIPQGTAPDIGAFEFREK
jgi:hypothetical protein